MWLDRIPASVAFCDVETTGLTKDDRIISFGGIGMISNARGRLRLDYTYLVFDPGKSNPRGAEQVHGFSDWVLAVQDRFEVHAAQVWRFLTSYELLVAHNAAFDFRFINREMTAAGLSSLARPIYCTMKGYRALGLGGSASLNAVCSQIKLARAGDLHDAIEDAWLAMQIYLWLHGGGAMNKGIRRHARIRQKGTARSPSEAGYQVGYGKPPQEHRFRPGQCGNRKGRPKEVPRITCQCSEPHWQLTTRSTSPNELNATLMPHNINHGDACFAYFNKTRGIPPNCVAGHVGFEPANPSASYLIGIPGKLRLK